MTARRTQQQLERQIGAFGESQKATASVGLVKHPQLSQLEFTQRLPADLRVEASPTQLRLPVRHHVAPSEVVLDDPLPPAGSSTRHRVKSNSVTVERFGSAMRIYAFEYAITPSARLDLDVAEVDWP